MRNSFAILLPCIVSAICIPLEAAPPVDGNLTVRDSLAVGFDAVNFETFDVETIVLKENNTRIRFNDTSSSGSFPNTDWQLTANDSNNGGANKFSIDDITNGRTPFTVSANAPTDSLFVRSNGNLGVRTGAPAEDLHIVAADSPTIRLDQNSGGSLPAQVWDLVGNEAGLIIRDDTGGVVPLKVKPGTPTDALVLGPNGAGLGVGNAANKLHVQESADLQAALIENVNANSAERTVLELKNNGPAALAISNTTTAATASDWTLTVDDNGAFVIASGGNPLMTVDAGGNVTTTGSVNPPSDRNRKENFASVDIDTVLERLSGIPVQTWKYRGDDAVHIGPMAQDFHAAFSVGADEKFISTVDADGVALASIQALHADAKAKDAEIESLRKENESLAERLSKLEALLDAR